MTKTTKSLKSKKLYLFDMDGTIYIDNNLFDGVTELLDYIINIGGRYMFITNNSSKNATDYVKKLNNMGIKAETKDFFTSTDATISFLLKKHYKKIYTFGTKSFTKQLHNAGLPVTDTLCDNIDCLCMGFDTELTFKKLEDACILLNKGVDYIATNPDPICPVWYGYVPDCGSISQILFNATKRNPKFIGKPEPEIINEAINKTKFTKEETVVIGDRLYTDIAGGLNAGVSTIYVLSGEGTINDIEKYNIHPDYIFENIKQIYDSIKGDH